MASFAFRFLSCGFPDSWQSDPLALDSGFLTGFRIPSFTVRFLSFGCHIPSFRFWVSSLGFRYADEDKGIAVGTWYNNLVASLSRPGYNLFDFQCVAEHELGEGG